MNIQSASYSGLQGLQRASAGITEATADINRQTRNTEQTQQETQVVDSQRATESAARAQTPAERPPELTDSLVRLNAEERNAQANVRSIQTADQVLGSVIDIRV